MSTVTVVERPTTVARLAAGLVEYRALVVLASRGPQRMVDIATELQVNPSTGTRMCDPLVRKGLARRYRTATDRRAVRLSLTPAGRHLVEQVTTRRRTELARIVADMPDHHRIPVITARRAFAAAAGEIPEQESGMVARLAPHRRGHRTRLTRRDQGPAARTNRQISSRRRRTCTKQEDAPDFRGPDLPSVIDALRHRPAADRPRIRR